DVADEFIYHLKSNFLMGLLTPLESQLNPHFEIVAQELDGVIAFDRQIMRVNGGRELELLHAAGRLRSPGLLAALGFLVKKLAVVDDPANGRHCVRDRLDEIQLLGLSQSKCV